MTEGREPRAPGPRSARDSGAPADVDLHSYDWRALIEQLPLAVYIDRLDETSSNVYTSPQLESVLGYTAAEWAADDHLLLKVLHPDDRDAVIAEHLRSRETGEPFRMEYRMIARDRRVVWLLDQATVVPSENGRPALHHGFYLDISERKELERALADSAERLSRQKRYFESLLEISPVAIVTTDVENVVTSWNPAAETLFGYVQEEALGRQINDLVAGSAEQRAEATSVARDALRGGRVQTITKRTHKDGSLIDVELLAAPVVLGGEVLGTYAIYHDVRELKRAEERYRTLVEELPLVTYVDEPDERAASIYISPQIEALLGYAPEEWLADPELFQKTLHPDDRERVVAELAAAFAAGDSNWSREYRLVSRDGRAVWLHDEALVVRDEQGTPLYVQGFHIDVSERKRAEEALRRSQAELEQRKQYLESLLELSPTAIVTIDVDEDVTSWNPAAEQLFGYTREEAIGRNIDGLVARSDEVHREAVDVSRQLGNGESVRRTTRRTRKDGTLVDVDVRAVPIFVGARQVGMYALYHDISDLLSARREAEAATEAKSAFLATMSHEIRTPLNAVIGMTELLLGTELTPEQREFADVVRTSGDALLGVINEILDFSKIEAGRLELEQRPLVLRDCVETALQMVAAKAAEKGLDVACLVDPEAPVTILADGTRLQQILVNLLTNAVKFTEEGEVVLTVDSQAVAEEANMHRLRFTVRDTGIGIPADRIDRLFDSFSQVDASTTRRYGGTGLGLAISKRLCELMGGEMWAESELGEGSAFHFALAAEATSDALQPRIAAELRGKRLLVVDDNAANREVVKRQARSWGMVPRETGSPAEALEWIRRGDPLDIAILDMQMPQMDGLALAREIRRHRDADALPLVMLTSLGRRRRDVEAGGEFAAFLTKPIKASQLYNAVAAALGAETTRAEEESGDAEPGPASGQPAQLRVLLAEDSTLNQRLALLLLEKLGYGADVAVNGVDALETLRRQQYDVVLMDVEMPEMDGLEASRRIHHEWPGGERPRIIAMTANAMEGDREICLAAGMDDYVSKPIHPEELADALRRCAPVHERSVLDPGALEQLRARAGDRAFVRKLVDTFLGDAPALLATLRSACEDAAAERLRRAAHTLKSNARVFGATRLAELCQELETVAKAEALARGPELVDQIDEEHARVARALREMA
jgi:PAS domain S-box-containing protein